MGRPKPVSVFAASSDRIGFRPELINSVGWHPRKSVFDNGIEDVEDFGTALIRYDNGAVTLLETSYSLNGESHNAKALYGTKGGVVMNASGTKIYTTMHNRLVDITPSTAGLPADSHFDREMAHFVDCCLNGTECIATADDGIWVMKILDAIYESARTGHEVEIK
jgi:predicted dehydrogenase